MPVSTERESRGTEPAATRQDVRRELGDFDDRDVSRILALGPTADQLRRACRRVGQEAGVEQVIEAVREVVAEAED